MGFNWKKAKEYEVQDLSDNDYEYSKVKKKDLKRICKHSGCSKVLQGNYQYCYPHYDKNKSLEDAFNRIKSLKKNK